MVGPSVETTIVLKGQFCFINVEIMFILSDTSSFLWIQTNTWHFPQKNNYLRIEVWLPFNYPFQCNDNTLINFGI
jgi:hypothetical protein